MVLIEYDGGAAALARFEEIASFRDTADEPYLPDGCRSATTPTQLRLRA